MILILTGVPVWTGRKMYTRYRHSSRLKRNFAIAGGVLAAVSIYFLLILLVINNISYGQINQYHNQN